MCGLWRRSAGSETVNHAQNNQAFLQAYVARARIVQKKTCIICWSARPRTGPPLCATASYSKTDAGVFSSDTLSPNPGFFGRVSISVSMPACHAGELGSIPRRGGSMILPIRNRMVSLFDEIPIFTWGWSPFLFRVAVSDPPHPIQADGPFVFSRTRRITDPPHPKPDGLLFDEILPNSERGDQEL